MSLHTKGPWTVSHFAHADDTKRENAGLYEVEEANIEINDRREDGKSFEQVADANARLIAAAPDLKDIALGVLTALSYPRGSEAQIRALEELGQDARATLSKAKA